MTPSGFFDLVRGLGITIAVVASLDDRTTEVFGEVAGLESKDLFQQLFGDAESFSALDRSLKGQILPRIWSQGRVSCLVCKPSETKIVGLLYHEERSVVARYRWSKEVNSQVCALWAVEDSGPSD